MVFDSFEFKAVSYKVKSLLIEALIFFFLVGEGGRGVGRTVYQVKYHVNMLLLT